MYYSASWQLLEERITDGLVVVPPAIAEVNRHMQYIWGNRYIDDIALRRQNVNLGNDSPDVTYEDTWYHLTDALFSTAVITNHAGVIAERVSYSPYGTARHHRAADLNGDGAVDFQDQTLLFSGWGAGFFADLNRDGTVNNADLNLLSASWGAAATLGRLSITDNIIGFAGYVFNAEFDDAGLYTVRHRHYEPELGRWLSRDPLGYVDGMGVYGALGSNPLVYTDPMGMQRVVRAPSRSRPMFGPPGKRRERWRYPWDPIGPVYRPLPGWRERPGVGPPGTLPYVVPVAVPGRAPMPIALPGVSPAPIPKPGTDDFELLPFKGPRIEPRCRPDERCREWETYIKTNCHGSEPGCRKLLDGMPDETTTEYCDDIERLQNIWSQCCKLRELKWQHNCHSHDKVHAQAHYDQCKVARDCTEILDECRRRLRVGQGPDVRSPH